VKLCSRLCALILLLVSTAGIAQSSHRTGTKPDNAPSKTQKESISEDAEDETPDPPAQPLVVDVRKSVATTPWAIVALLTTLTLLPAILLATTPFVRLLVIFHFLRQALGTQGIPTNQTLIGLSLFLTYFIMQPVGATVYKDAIAPLQDGKIQVMDAIDKGSGPVKDFMLRYTREKDLALFVELSKEPRPKKPADLSMRVVVPAYIISELKAGFQIGAVLFLPFLVIDMAVASITTSVGMMQLPPVVISTPLKLLVFVMADGWNLLVGAILRSFY
jgi:flagellar biosynthetic protein FliP